MKSRLLPLLGIALIAVLQPSVALAMALLMAPAALAALTLGGGLARSVALLGLAMALPPAAALWQSSGDADAALEQVEAALAFAWIVQAAGWAATELGPLFLVQLMDSAARRKAARLEAALQRYRSEWDSEDLKA